MSYEVYKTMFGALEASTEKEEPVKDQGLALPYDFPAKEQTIIEKARAVIVSKARIDSAAWGPIVERHSPEHEYSK